MSLRKKLFLSFLALACLVGVASFYFIQRLHEMNEIVETMLSVDVKTIYFEKGFREAFYRMQSAGRRYLDKGNPEDLRAMEDFKRTCVEQLERIVVLLDSAKERKILAQIEAGYRRMNLLFAEDISSRKANALGEAPNEAKRFQTSEEIAKNIHALVRLSDQSIGLQVSRAQKIGTTGRQIGFVVAGIGLSVGFVLAWLLTRRITRPIVELGQATERVAAGEFHVRTPERGNDELTQLARQFNQMATRLAELDGAKSAFIANVSHELRTPLTSIREANKLIQDGLAGPLTSQQRELLDISMEACRRLIDLVKDVLELSKMKAHVVPFRFEPTPIDSLIEECLSEFRLVAQKKGIAVEFSAEGEVPPVVVDRQRVAQAISTLLTNALKFTAEHGRISVTRRVAAAPDSPPPWGRASPSSATGRSNFETPAGKQAARGVDSRRVVGAISDSGAGIAPDRLTEIRRRLESGTVGVEGGLGLAIAREVAIAHNGDLVLESQQNVGTTVRFSLPVTSPKREGA
ncbi:MAG: HAMP domain-containing protein [Deltaproteobacteria bacterium]|nr:HAMP domain-containing protein [Deltaproteobacteria bacterium]